MNTVFYMIEADHRTHGPAATQRIITEKVSGKPLVFWAQLMK